MKFFVAVCENPFKRSAQQPFFAFEEKVAKNTFVEMKGLGIPAAEKFKPKSSNKSSVYILKSGGVLVKYGYRYILLQHTSKARTSDMKSLGMTKKNTETKVFEV